MIIILLTNRNLACEVVGSVGKHLAGTMHVPGKRRINIHLLLASLTAGVLGLAALGVVAGDKFAPPANGAKNQQYAGPPFSSTTTALQFSLVASPAELSSVSVTLAWSGEPPSGPGLLTTGIQSRQA